MSSREFIESGAAFPDELRARQEVVCDPFNPCPDRPKRFLGRFQTRPWRCPQCSRWWVTELRTSYPCPEGYWTWIRAERKNDDG